MIFSVTRGWSLWFLEPRRAVLNPDLRLPNPWELWGAAWGERRAAIAGKQKSPVFFPTDYWKAAILWIAFFFFHSSPHY